MNMKRTACLRFLIFGAIILPSIWGQTKAASWPDGLYAELQTNKGNIVLRLEFEKTPMTVANFVGLAEGTIINKSLPLGTPYFNGSIFHRVVAGHVIQAGKPGGTSLEGPGYEIPNEIVSGLGHGRAGMLGMANSGPHTAGSQFYVTLGDRSYLDGDYAVFGEVASGLDVVQKIVQGDVVERVAIRRVGSKAQVFKSDDASFRRLVDIAKARVAKQDKEKKRREAELIRKRWPQALPIKPGLLSIVLKQGTGELPQPGATLTAGYRGEFLDGRQFVSMPDDKPGFGRVPHLFPFIIGVSSINSGIDSVLGIMKKGEKRLLIVSPEQGYGSSGFYAKSEPGKKRFVISPNTTLIYEIEVR
jgi:cyclophilin family peptidyl-prolyl cis-trans isomerase